MSEFKILATCCIFFILAGCATFEKDIQKAAKNASTLIKHCSSNDIMSMSSVNAIRDDLEKNLLAQLGLIPIPDSTGIEVHDIQSILSDIVSKFSTLKSHAKAEQQQPLKNVTDALGKLRNNAKTIKTSFTSSFATWRDDYNKSSCGSNPQITINCYLNITGFLNKAAASAQDDISELKTDADNLFATAENALNSFDKADANLVKDIRDDIEKLDLAIEGMVATVEEIVQGTRKGDSAVAKAIENVLKMEIDKYVAYETTTFAMNQLLRVARKVEVKLDEIDQKTWFILSALELTSAFISTDFESLDKENGTGKQYRSTKSLKNEVSISNGVQVTNNNYVKAAAAAYACNRLGADSSAAPSDSSRTDVLLYPLYIQLVQDATKKEVKTALNAQLNQRASRQIFWKASLDDKSTAKELAFSFLTECPREVADKCTHPAKRENHRNRVDNLRTAVKQYAAKMQ